MLAQGSSLELQRNGMSPVGETNLAHKFTALLGVRRSAPALLKAEQLQIVAMACFYV